MINIIVCVDNKNDLNKIRKSINKIMKSLKIDYKENVFMDYDESFMKIIDKKIPFKFYILDFSALQLQTNIKKAEQPHDYFRSDARNSLCNNKSQISKR